MKSRQSVLVVSGLPGVGKTTASFFFRRNHIPILRMGSITDRLLYRFNLRPSEKNEQKLRQKLRRVYGAQVYAEGILKKAWQKLKSNSLVVIEGARSPDEVAYLKTKLPNIRLLFIETKAKIRYQRLEKRTTRPLTAKEIRRRDSYEKGLGIMKLRQIADFRIQNKDTKANFYEKLNRILAKNS